MCIASNLKRISLRPARRPLSNNSKSYLSTSSEGISFYACLLSPPKNQSSSKNYSSIFYPGTIKKHKTRISNTISNSSTQPNSIRFLHSSRTGVDESGGSVSSVVSSEFLDISKEQGEEGGVYKELLNKCRDNRVQEKSSVDQAKALAQVQPTKFKEESKHDQYQSIINDESSSLEEKLAILGKKSRQQESPRKVYTHLIHLYGLRGDYKKADDVFNLMAKNKVTPDSRTYHALMNAYSNGGELTKTIEIFELIRKNPADLDPHPYSVLIKAYMKHKRVQDAFDVIDIMKQKMKPDVFDYTALIQACIGARDIDKAWDAYELMKKDGCQPNLLTYTILIAVAQKRNIEKALDLFDEMLKRGITPGLKAMNSFLTALASCPEHYDSSLELLNILVTKQDFKPDNFIFAAMLRGAQMAKNLSDSRIFFYKIMNSNPTSMDLQVAISTMYLAYSQAYKRDGEERTIGSLETPPPSDLDFLCQPVPTCVNDCVIEALKIYNFFDHSLNKKQTLISKNRVNEEFLYVLTSYNYFKETLDFYNKNFTGEAKPHPNIIGSIIQMCARIRKKNAFYSVLKQADLLLAPILPTSSLDMREKTEYKHKAQLVAIPLTGLYQAIIVGLAEFGDIALALHYFEIQCQDPDLKRPHSRNYYPLFFRIVQKSKNPSYISRLNNLLSKYKPQFC